MLLPREAGRRQLVSVLFDSLISAHVEIYRPSNHADHKHVLPVFSSPGISRDILLDLLCTSMEGSYIRMSIHASSDSSLFQLQHSPDASVAPTVSCFVFGAGSRCSIPPGAGPVGTSVQGEIRYEDQVLVTLPLDFLIRRILETLTGAACEPRAVPQTLLPLQQA